MSKVKGISERNWILALFIRSDGERLLLGDGEYEFSENQQHFAPNEISSTTIDVQSGDGTMLSAQVRRAGVQNFDGYIGDATFTKARTQESRNKFINFFKVNYFYEVVYIFSDGDAIKRQSGFIVDAPSVPELYQIHPEYHVALSFEDVNYYRYLEDAAGNEIYGQKVEIAAASSVVGGFVWDEEGLVWDEVGAVCEGGAVGNTIIQNNSAANIYPIWTIYGPAAEPKLENITTGEAIILTARDKAPDYDDFRISAKEKIVVDIRRHTATLYYDNESTGNNILGYMSGAWMSLVPGRNELEFSSDNANTPPATIEWAEVVA